MNTQAIFDELAERALLASLKAQPGRLADLGTRVGPDDFGSPVHHVVFDALHAVVNDAPPASVTHAPIYRSPQLPVVSGGVQAVEERRARAQIGRLERARYLADLVNSVDWPFSGSEALARERAVVDRIHREVTGQPAPATKTVWVHYTGLTGVVAAWPAGKAGVVPSSETDHPRPLTVHAIQEMPVSRGELGALADRLGERVHIAQVTVARWLPDSELGSEVAAAIRSADPVVAETGFDFWSDVLDHPRAAETEFDIWRDVIGDDLVVEGVVYDSDVWQPDGEGGVEELSPEEQNARRLHRAAQWEREEFERNQVPGVTTARLAEELSGSGSGFFYDEEDAAAFLDALTEPSTISGEQVKAYAEIVLEASIRRDLSSAGVETGWLNDTGLALGDGLHLVEVALTQIDAARQRWDRLHPAPFGQEPDDPAAAPRPPLIAARLGSILMPDRGAPEPDDVADAEHTIVGNILRKPELLPELHDRLHPEDFTTDLGNVYRAAVAVHTARGRLGKVDLVTVDWQQLRQQREYDAGVVSTGELIHLVDEPPRMSMSTATDIVLHGALHRLIADAAYTVQKVSHDLTRTLPDALDSSALAYDVVRVTADRMATGDTAGHLSRTGGPRTHAQIHRLRQHRDTLVARLDHSDIGTAPRPPLPSETAPETGPAAEF